MPFIRSKNYKKKIKTWASKKGSKKREAELENKVSDLNYFLKKHNKDYFVDLFKKESKIFTDFVDKVIKLKSELKESHPKEGFSSKISKKEEFVDSVYNYLMKIKEKESLENKKSKKSKKSKN